MSETPNETKWRTEFESHGEAEVRRRAGNNDYTAEGKADYCRRWLDDQVKARYSREVWLYRYSKWTFVVAIIAVIVGIIGIIVTVGVSLHSGSGDPTAISVKPSR